MGGGRGSAGVGRWAGKKPTKCPSSDRSRFRSLATASQEPAHGFPWDSAVIMTQKNRTFFCWLLDCFEGSRGFKGFQNTREAHKKVCETNLTKHQIFKFQIYYQKVFKLHGFYMTRRFYITRRINNNQPINQLINY